MADAGTHTEPTDRDLVESFVNDRCERSFRILYHRYTPALFRIALRMSAGRRRDAEDSVQIAWIRAAEGLSGFRWESALSSWLTGITLNCCREANRQNARYVSADVDASTGPASSTGIDAGGSSSTHSSGNAWGRIDLDRAIGRLPLGYREVLILHDVEGYTHVEIGSLLGIEPGTSKSQLSRARRSMREWLNATRERHEPRYF